MKSCSGKNGKFVPCFRIADRDVRGFHGGRPGATARSGKRAVLIHMLDTDTCIYTIKRKPMQVLHRLETMSLGSLAMSAITFAELTNGAKKSLQVEANLKRLHELSKIVAIFPFDEKAFEIYGDVRSELEKEGKPIGANDMLIAAHALSLGLILATNTEREFGRIRGLKIENWVQEREPSTDMEPQFSKKFPPLSPI